MSCSIISSKLIRSDVVDYLGAPVGGRTRAVPKILGGLVETDH